jgi:hypothetical protein
VGARGGNSIVSDEAAFTSTTVTSLFQAKKILVPAYAVIGSADPAEARSTGGLSAQAGARTAKAKSHASSRINL